MKRKPGLWDRLSSQILGSGERAAGDRPASEQLERTVLARATAQLFEQLASWVGTRIENANDMTSREVLAAGASLDSIVREARAHVGATRAALARLASNDESSVARTISEQASTIGEHVRLVDSTLSAQCDIADGAKKSLSAITGVAERIGTLAQSARILSLNASIEAARLQNAGAFPVIATEMTRLTEDVRTANTQIQKIVLELQNTLPRVAELAHASRSESDRFSEHMDDHMRRVDSSVGSLRLAVAGVLTEGDSRLESVLRHSQDALSHLQFQDTCAQSLRIVARDVMNAGQRLVEWLRNGAPAGREPLHGLRAALAHRAAGAGEVVALKLDSESAHGPINAAPELKSGELLLF